MAARKKAVAEKKPAAASKPARKKPVGKKRVGKKPAAKKNRASTVKPGAKGARRAGAAGKTPGKPRLLSGGNPQIAKGVGDAPVQAYIAAIPGWKQPLARRLDALIEQAVPGVCKAVKWNSPFYGLQDGLWFLSFHCFERFLKVMFMRGTSLSPPPPGPSKHADVRYYDIREGGLDERQFTAWVEQAAKLPGLKM